MWCVQVLMVVSGSSTNSYIISRKKSMETHSGDESLCRVPNFVSTHWASVNMYHWCRRLRLCTVGPVSAACVCHLVFCCCHHICVHQSRSEISSSAMSSF
jgi:hypothetical protein